MAAKKTSSSKSTMKSTAKSTPKRTPNSTAKKSASTKSASTKSAKKKVAAKTGGARGAKANGAAAARPASSSPAKKKKKKKNEAKVAASTAPSTRPAEARDEVMDELAEPGKSTASSDLASRIIDGESEKTVTALGDELVSGKKSVAAQAARVLDEILEKKPEAVVAVIDRFVKAIADEDKRPAQTAANALPVMARVAPARVARHLAKLKDGFDHATPVGKDGLVRTFAGLCTASVAYQKRLEGVLNKALAEADAKTLAKWTEVVLPALKGEPHARARATVEARLGRIPKAVAQKIADFLGIKLRLRYR